MIKATNILMADIQRNAIILLENQGYNPNDSDTYYPRLEATMKKLLNSMESVSNE